VRELENELAKLQRRLEREKKSRVDAEAIAERGLRALYEKQRQLELLEKIAAAANESTSVHDAIRFTIATVCQYTGWSVGNAFLIEDTPEGRRLVPTGLWHAANPQRVEAFRIETERAQFASGEGLPGRVLATKAPAWISDVGRDENFPRVQMAHSVGLKAAFAFPVLAGTEVAAVLEFFSDQAHETDEILLHLMAQIGNQLGRVVDRKRGEAQLVYNATHDALTHLPNRRHFLDRLDDVLERRRREADTRFAVLFVDLDHFKVVNDSLGHQAGDALIVSFAQRIGAALRCSAVLTGSSTAKAMLARLGGDEFVILLEGIADAADALAIADLIQQQLEQPFGIEGQEVYASASVGVVADSADGDTAVDILRNADLALYRAKALGKSQHALFDHSMHMDAMQRLTLESELRAALRKQEFVLHYQPIVSLNNSKIMGFEALVRWNKNGTQLVYPGDFIQVAEDTGMILPLGLWVLETACRTMHRLHQTHPQNTQPYVSINLSVRQFTQPDLVPQVAGIIRKTGIDPGSVRLEITESVAMLEGSRAERILSDLKAIGVRLAIDDFGTGYSSLSRLHDYPLEVLKIDRSFVSRMRSGPDGMQIVQTIINLANSLRMKVVAEGVETQTELALLKSMGCELGQGYLFSKPVGEAEIASMLAAVAPAGRATDEPERLSA
jgi:diguanylate cyclase (GGDEF)-like protein